MLPEELGDTIQHPVQLLPFLLGDLGGIVIPAPDFEEDSRCGRIYGPAGAITLDGTIYLYAMRVTHWGTASDPSVSGYGVLFRQETDGSFTQTANWGAGPGTCQYCTRAGRSS